MIGLIDNVPKNRANFKLEVPLAVLWAEAERSDADTRIVVLDDEATVITGNPADLPADALPIVSEHATEPVGIGRGGRG